MTYRRLLVAALATGAAVVPAEAGAARLTLGDRPLSMGSQGRDVRILQRHLTRVGVRTHADGHFGPKTARRVRAWERRSRLAVDGRISAAEAKLLREQVAGGIRLQALPRPAPAPAPAPAAAVAAPAAVEHATIGADGLAIAPAGAPEAVKRIIAAGNQIHSKPYRYGGGHGRWNDSGYDCSGSISYALHGAGLLSTALDSTGFMSFGEAGAGQWVSIYGNPGHAYMVVAGLRFDTSGREGRNSRWTTEQRSPKGYTVRHPAGL